MYHIVNSEISENNGFFRERNFDQKTRKINEYMFKILIFFVVFSASFSGTKFISDLAFMAFFVVILLLTVTFNGFLLLSASEEIDIPD